MLEARDLVAALAVGRGPQGARGRTGQELRPGESLRPPGATPVGGRAGVRASTRRARSEAGREVRAMRWLPLRPLVAYLAALVARPVMGQGGQL